MCGIAGAARVYRSVLVTPGGGGEGGGGSWKGAKGLRARHPERVTKARSRKRGGRDSGSLVAPESPLRGKRVIVFFLLVFTVNEG